MSEKQNVPWEGNYPLLWPRMYSNNGQNIHSKSNLTSNVYATWRQDRETDRNGEREGGEGGEQECRCIWGHTNQERQTDGRTGRVRKEWRETEEKNREIIRQKERRRLLPIAFPSRVHSLPGLHIFSPAHPHTETERRARRSSPCMQRSFSSE